MAFEEITANDLRIGLYIKIEGSWFSHPFPTNTFKVKCRRELTTLCGLTKVKLLYDPEKSDAEGSVNDGEGEEQSAMGADEGSSESDAAMQEELVQQKIELQDNYRNYQEHLRKVEQDYREVLREGKVMLQDLSAGSSRGLLTAKKMIGSLNDILVSNDSSRALMNLMGSNETGEEFLLHSLNVCTLSILIARDLGLKRHEIEKIAMGALLHDIGELKYSAEMLLKKSRSTSADTKAVLKKHPRYGKDTLTAFPTVPHECLDIVLQHHERLNGSGYPSGLKEAGITQYAKIVMVADAYDELCNHPIASMSLTPSEALSVLYTKERGGLWSDAVVTLIRQLGVYPPGSLVVLTNGSMGLVTSVNMEARLRPIVMVYSPDIPKEEAMILDLARMEEISIKEAVRPRELSPEIRDYLNPRRIISYYPSTTEVAEAVPALVE
ncbi:HD-GYP domain-containing protein [Candidatus Nitrospira salsa]